jgi:predicted RNA-binding protein
VILRVKKEDSAYVYQVIESYEGITNHSTLGEVKGTPHRDVILHIAPDLRHHVERMVEELKKEIAIEVINDPDASSKI